MFVRQAQVRYTYGGFSIAAENPQTTIMPYRAGSTNPNATQINSDDNAFPDLIGRYIMEGRLGQRHTRRTCPPVEVPDHRRQPDR